MARYYFNNGIPSTDVGPCPIKAVGVSFMEDRFGNSHSACYLNGNGGSYLNLGTSRVLKPARGTISLWVKIVAEINSGNGYRGNPIILTKRCAGNDYYEAYAMDFDLQTKNIAATNTESVNNQILAISLAPVTMNQWHHLVMTYDDHYLCLYIDGELQRRVCKNFRTSFLEGDSVMIGNSANIKNNRFLAGYVDDISLYNRVLSPEEILNLYHEPDPNKQHLIFKFALIFFASLAGIVGIVLLTRRKFKKELEKEKEKNRLQRQMSEMEMSVIKAQMNPHFIFNAINSIYNFVLTGDRKASASYIARFARLIRNVLEFSSLKKITLEQELETLRLYIDIEQLRFREPFEYEINIAADLIPASVQIVPLLIQPYVENAIWHGLSPKDGKGKLTISITQEGGGLCCVIDDNGIGRSKAAVMEQIGISKKPMSSALNHRRLALLSELYGSGFDVQYVDKELPDGTKAGTRIILHIPELKIN